MLSAICHQIIFGVAGTQPDLIHRGRYFRRLEQCINVMLQEVADTDSPYPPRFIKVLTKPQPPQLKQRLNYLFMVFE
jgi:hypothetical protein